MKRKIVMKVLCVSIVSAMLVSNAAVLVAADGMQTVIYNGQQLDATVNGEKVILPNGQIVSIHDCQFPIQQGITQTQPESKPEQTAGVLESDSQGTQAPSTENKEETVLPDNVGNGEVQISDNTEGGNGTETPDNPTPETPDDNKDNEEVPETPVDPEAPVDPETPVEPEAPDNEGTVIPSDPSVKPVPDTTDTAASTTQEPSKEEIKAPSFAVTAPSLKAGIGFYVDELKDTYHISFSKNFADMIAEIESEYGRAVLAENLQKEETAGEPSVDIVTLSEKQNEVTTAQALISEEDAEITGEAQTPEIPEFTDEEAEVSIKNWQDVLAVYLMEQSRAGVKEFKIDESVKGRLAELVAQMNTSSVTEDGIVSEPQYIADYIEANADVLTDVEKEFLQTYTSPNFMLLCAAATGAEGFITESLGEDVSSERAQVVAAAYSLVGKIPYFWGGKSTVVGWDDRWGSAAEVIAAGTSSSGTIQSYGLDCSGFVTWSFVNGYENSAAASLIGHGTATQWAMSEEITEEEAMPGDLVFLQQPNSAGINHVGIVVGRNDDGSLIAVHCNAGKNGVTVDSAYQAGFRYVRRPLSYDDNNTKETSQKQVGLQNLKDQIAANE